MIRIITGVLSACGLLLAPLPAYAATLTVKVTDAAGRAVPDAVVSAELPGARPMPVGSNYTMLQQSMTFVPFVLVVPVGAKVSFPNRDNTRHQVYSFSEAKRFELKLFGHDESRSVLFDKPGVVALGCNIHDAMSAFIFVTKNAWTVKTDARGMAVLPDLPNAAGQLSVWHPYLRGPATGLRVALAAGQKNATVAVKLRAPPMHAMSGY